MDELIKTFHIDWKLIIAQLVNFAIVLFVLKKFAYEPVLKMMNERTNKIEKGLKDAEDAKNKVLEMESKEKEVLKEAREKAQEIIKKSEETANKNKEEIILEAKKQSEKIASEGQKKMEEERNKIMSEVKSEISGLVISATEKLISEKIDKIKDKELIEEAIK